MNHKQKIVEYIDFKGVTANEFCRKCGFSGNFLNSGKHLGSDKLAIVLHNYADLNVFWLLFDKEPMIKSIDTYTQPNLKEEVDYITEETEGYKKTNRCIEIEKRFALLEDYNNNLKKTNEALLKQLEKNG